ncbi:MAG TPA: hypothetical protein VGO31_16280 [Microbacteriaceae bacterium]|jgi:hypothetical protein|nr:hypothetical protein [Microbacteriaceae bacterium]
MEVTAFLADSAEAVQGKIYALGIGWNAIFAQVFPVSHPRLALGITIQVPYTATNHMHTVTVHLETEDGERVQLGFNPQPGGEPAPVYELGGSFNVGRPPMLVAGDEQIVPFAMTIDQLLFEAPGMFAWVVSIDGAEMKRIPMRVSALPGGLQ